MIQEWIDLQPDNYLTLDKEIIFYIGDKVQRKNERHINEIINQILSAEVLTVCGHHKGDQFDYCQLLLPDFLVNFCESVQQNIQILAINQGIKLKETKKFIYNHGVYTLIPANGAAVIINNVKQPNHSDSDATTWQMDEERLKQMFRSITAYFDLEKESENENRVDRRMRRNVIEPVYNYTKYENIVEMQATMGNDYISYEECEITTPEPGKNRAVFYSRSFDPENMNFSVDSFVDVETTEEINDETNRRRKGVIVEREITDKGMSFTILLKGQFNHSLIPKQGRIFMQMNDVQKRVREKVLHAIEWDQVESKYMYRFFKDFSTSGYKRQDGWDDFRKELEAQKYPPNERQMEAIQRGIETEDIQLVLGPPGTGKTTVIVSWINFFIRRNKRILISSQNNSAVDNVLERAGKNPAAKIVRIGNAEKVQENCRCYLPERQVGELADIYGKALDRGISSLISDQRKLHNMLEEVKLAIAMYRDARESLRILSATQDELYLDSEMMLQCERQREGQTAVIHEIMEARAQKKIYLYDTKGRNFLVRFLRMPYTKRVKEQLRASETDLKRELQKYDEIIERYNAAGRRLSIKLNDEKYVRQKSCTKEKVGRCQNKTWNAGLTSVYKNRISIYKTERENVDSSLERLMKLKQECETCVQLISKAVAALSGFEQALEQKRNDIVTNILLESSNVVGATCIGINSKRDFAGIKFDVTIIDEAGQIQIHNAIVPMSRARKTLMLGDHLQIPPLVNDDLAAICKTERVSTELLEKSFFEYLFTRMEAKDALTPNLTRLNEQFRMPGNISEVISNWFYGGEYHAHYDMSQWRPMVPGTKRPLLIVDTSEESKRAEYSEDDARRDAEQGRRVEPCLAGPGYANVLEARIAADIVEALVRSGNVLQKDEKGNSLKIQDYVGIISAYGKQVRTIRNELKKRRLGLEEEQIFGMCASLDSFQGQERPVIIYSSTRSTLYKRPQSPRIGFMKELRRLNVAFTRCQKQLVIIGDIDYLTGCEYEKTDPETGEVLSNQSEKKYAEFMRTVVAQAKSEKGEFLSCRELRMRMRGNRE